MRVGLPNTSSGFAGLPSTTTENSASRPIAASAGLFRARGDALDAALAAFVAMACSRRPPLDVESRDDAPALRAASTRRSRSRGADDRRLAAMRAERTRPRAGQLLSRERRVALDRVARVEIDVADAIDVHGGAPAVRRRAVARARGAAIDTRRSRRCARTCRPPRGTARGTSAVIVIAHGT